jgi:hypothetical protein
MMPDVPSLSGEELWHRTVAIIDQIVASAHWRERGRLRSKLLRIASDKVEEHLNGEDHIKAKEFLQAMYDAGWNIR